MKKIRYLFQNSYSFLKSMTRIKIFWESSVAFIENSNIATGVKLYMPYSINFVSIKKGTYVSPNSHISMAQIGKFCSIGPNFLCGWGIHPLYGISTSPVFYSIKKQTGYTLSNTDKTVERKSIVIGNDVFIGANVTVLDGVTIGDGCVIGAGAIVSKNIPPYAIAVGCPIQIVKYRFKPEIIEKLLKVKWWDQNDEILKLVEKEFFNIDAFISKVEVLLN